jgi:heptosyltransferase-2
MVKKGIESLFSGHPFIRKVIVWDKRAHKYQNLFSIIRDIRKQHYELVINLQRFFNSGLVTILSGSRETRGFKKNPLSWFFTRRYDHDITSGKHETTRNNMLIGDLSDSNWNFPRLYPSPEQDQHAKSVVQGTAYTISPASLWFTKQFPAERWVELAALIPHDSEIFLLGGRGDRALCDEIILKSHHPGMKNLAGDLTLLQSAALMKYCRMNFTNDSSPLHLASAVNAPVTAVFCSTIPGFGFGPLSDDSEIVEVEDKLPCRPCGLHGRPVCPEIHFRCAKSIAISKLKARLLTGLV